MSATRRDLSPVQLVWSWILGLADLVVGLASRGPKFLRGGFAGAEAISTDVIDKDGLEEVELRFGNESEEDGGIRCAEAVFRSPMARHLPEESRTGYVLRVSPPPGIKLRGAVVLMAATGDKGYESRKKSVAVPLAKRGYMSLVLMAPMYAKRRPAGQKGHYINTVGQYMIKAYANIAEGAKLLAWMRRTYAGVPVGIAGFSFAGGMAASAAILDGGEVAMTSHAGALGPHVMTGGVISMQMDWDALRKDLGPHARRRLHEYFLTQGLGPYYESVGRPRSPNLVAVSTIFRHDRFVKYDAGEEMHEILSQASGVAELHVAPGGHITAFASMHTFVSNIERCFELLRQHTGPSEDGTTRHHPVPIQQLHGGAAQSRTR